MTRIELKDAIKQCFDDYDRSKSQGKKALCWGEWLNQNSQFELYQKDELDLSFLNKRPL
jgi:hypothetical protein